ncbi:hypothetical protein [Lysinibacillus antri]|uniref:Uncharacterized protein n=1 Tax=Lysinibacillus antri TaxID=2498145 RepID=A0A3S0P3Z7_9BACI|nr:hypothetical protein [Lysinibacillus antri]RUL52127.1 hypothetical protein EK386_09740 [Lysinibacillus antri]
MLQTIGSSDITKVWQTQNTGKSSNYTVQNIENEEIQEAPKTVKVNGVEYNSEDVERWDSYIKNLHPTFLAFGIVATEGSGTEAVPAGTTSIHFYDFCSMLERGEIISPDNVRSGEMSYENAHWKERLELATFDNGQRDEIKSGKILEIINRCYELGMMSSNNNLILPDELSKIRLNKKFEEQQSILHKPHLQNLEVRKKSIEQFYKSKQIRNAYQNSI